MNSENVPTNAQNTLASRLQSDVPGEQGKNVPTLDDVHRRALEIHNERRGHDFDPDNYLDAWLQAEHELREKLNKNNHVDPKKK